MQLSAYVGDMFITELLIENDFNINEDLGMGWTALHYTARLGHTDLAKYLIDNNADITLVTEEAMTPLSALTTVAKEMMFLSAVVLQTGV